jgi:predicted nucleotidyltransferase
MKRDLALRRLQRIIDRINAVNGVFETPDARYPAVRLINVWLFGSLLKGSETPNDIDLLFEYEELGELRTLKETGVYDKDYYRTYGMKCTIDTWKAFGQQLRKNIPMVRMHKLMVDGSVAYPRALIYPTLEFDMR